MKQWGHTIATGFLLLSFGSLLFALPDQCAEGARQGVSLCLDLIIPSLFPFFVLSSLAISTGLAGLVAKPLEKPMQSLFGLGSSGASLLVLGAIGGYPSGVRSLAQMTARGDCTHQEAQHLSLFCNNCGPAFFLGVVGAELFGSRKAGLILWGTHLLAALLIGLFSRPAKPGCKTVSSRPIPMSPLSSQLPEAVGGAFMATLNVCGYVVLFSVLSGTLSVLPFSFLQYDLARSLCIGFLELSTGVTALQNITVSPAALPLAAFLLGWGGCSVHCQTLPFLREMDLPVKPYLLAKFCQGVLAAGLTILLCLVFPLSLPVMAQAETLSPTSLLGQEMTALWALAGCYTILAGKRGGKADKKPL